MISMDDRRILVDVGFHPDTLKTIQSIPGGNWSKSKRVWEFPHDCALAICQALPEEDIAPLVRELAQVQLSRKENLALLNRQKMTPSGIYMAHQRRCIDIAHIYDRYGFFLDTGTGKTVMALGIIEESLPHEKWLVITPRPIIKTAWVEDNQTFFKNMMLLPISRNMNLQDYEEMAEFYKIRMPFRLNVDRARDHLKQYAKGFIINPESFKIDLDKVIRKLGITGMVIDESSIMKDATTKTAKAILEFGEEVKRAYPMSGKPAPNDELEYFSQMQLIDKSIFGTRYTKFRDLYAIPHPAGFGYRVTPIGALEIAQRIASWCIFISKEECLDLP